MYSRLSHSRKNVPYPIIVLASNGDVDAICYVLQHYEGYIRALSTKHYYDPFGYSHRVVDETIQRRLESKLISKVMAFKVA